VSFPSSSYSTLSFWALASTFSLLPLCFKHFLLTSSSSQTEKKKKKKKKKTMKKKNNAKKERNFPSKFPLCPLTFGTRFCPPTSTLFVLNDFSWHFLLFKQKKRKKM
jgi:hypothetical protein